MPPVRTPRDLGSTVRGRREDLGWSQAELARRAGVSRWWIGQLEKGRPGAPVDLVLRTFEALALTLEVPFPGRPKVSAGGSEASVEIGAEGAGRASRRSVVPAVDLDRLLADYGRDAGTP